MPQCPVCHGSQLVGHPAGWLTVDHTTSCSIRDAEDATRAADYGRGYGQGSPAEQPLGVDINELSLCDRTITYFPADARRIGDGARAFSRNATPTEQQLLIAFGYATPTQSSNGTTAVKLMSPGPLRTVVSAPTAGGAILNRRWPQLEAQLLPPT